MEFRKLSHNDLPEAMAEMLLRLDRIEANQKAESTERTDLYDSDSARAI